MIIQCERCNRKFKIDDSLIKPPGNRVRCSRCGNTFFVEKKQDSEPKTQPVHTQADFVNEEKGFELEDSSVKAYEEKKGDSESSDFSPDVEKSEAEEEAIFQEKERISPELLPSQKDSDTDIRKEPIDGINWEEFVSITKAKKDEEKFDLRKEKDLGIGKKEEPSKFNWEKLTIETEPEEHLAVPPKLFEETPEETNAASPKEHEPIQENRFGTEVPIEPKSNTLTVDNERLLITKKATLRPSSNPSSYGLYASLNVKPTKKDGVAGGIIKKLTYAVITIPVLVIIIGASVVILANQGFITQEKISRISDSILSKLPVRLTEDTGKGIIVSDLLSRWISTRNGLIYVVSGNITNQSKYVVNYVKIKSEFISDGKTLFEQVVYAGNTFTEDELRTLPLEDIMQKLDRKNGDIDFDNPKKLAGLNYGVEPGESVPFFTIFPSESKILGLKYKIDVTGFEKSDSEQ